MYDPVLHTHTHTPPETNHLHFCNKILSHIKLRVYRSHILRNVWLLLPYEEELTPARSWYKIHTSVGLKTLQLLCCSRLSVKNASLNSCAAAAGEMNLSEWKRGQKQLYCMHAYMVCDFRFYKGRKKVHSITWAKVSWALGSRWPWCWLLPHYHHHCDCLCCDPGAS